MVNVESANQMDHSNGKQNDDLIPNIPGGKQHQLLDEPTLPEATATSNMGCVSGKEDKADLQSESVERKPMAKGGQQKIDDYFRSEENKGSHVRQNKNNQSPKRPTSDDDGNDNENNKRSRSKKSVEETDNDNNRKTLNTARQSSPITRSSGFLSKIYDQFDDSEDEDTKSYSRFSSWAKTDIADYRNNYPHVSDNRKINDNYKFYTNQIRSYPDGDYIDNIHKNWFGNYRKLEYHHGYIQWLFPLQEKGLNWSAEPLQKHEIEQITKDKKALERVLESYKLMLDFYGFELKDEKTGELRYSKHYQDRFYNLNTSSHNYLRITRILKCLGELDYEHLKFGFLEAILRECITENTLENCFRSCKDYWIETLRSQEERRAIRQFGNELIKHRNDRTQPPRSLRAVRPSSTLTSNIKQTSISKNKRSNSNE